MLETLIVALTLAAASPSVVYKADPKASADVGTVALPPIKSPCYQVVRAALLASSRKSDRTALYVLTVTLADAAGPFQMERVVRPDGQPLRQVSLRHGDVACTEYQCPTGSAGVYELSAADREAAAAGGLTVTAKTNIGARCDVPVSLRKAEFDALAAWMDRLPAPRG